MKYRFKFSDFSPICRSRREFGRDFRWWPDGTDRGRNLCVARKVSHNFFRVACLPRINKCSFFASRFTLLTKAYSVDWKSSGVYLQGTLTPLYLQISLLIFRSKYWMKLSGRALLKSAQKKVRQVVNTFKVSSPDLRTFCIF